MVGFYKNFQDLLIWVNNKSLSKPAKNINRITPNSEKRETISFGLTQPRIAGPIIPAFWGAILQEVVDLITILLALLAKTKPTSSH